MYFEKNFLKFFFEVWYLWKWLIIPANHPSSFFDWDSPPSLDYGANYSSFILE
nr:MAG TPA: hypothetical protein [Crassvirales sp.]